MAMQPRRHGIRPAASLGRTERPETYECAVNDELLDLDVLDVGPLALKLSPYPLSDAVGVEEDDELDAEARRAPIRVDITLTKEGGKDINGVLDLAEGTIEGRGLGRWLRPFGTRWLLLTVLGREPLVCRIDDPEHAPITTIDRRVEDADAVTRDPQPDIVTGFPIHWDSSSADAVLHAVRAGKESPRDIGDLRQSALQLALRPGFDTLLSLDIAHGVQPYDYQTRTVKTVLQQMRGRALLCDEVGLGKTVEAGLIMMEYLARGLAGKILILTPSSLVEQWREEMQTKFSLDFVTHDDPRVAGNPAAYRELDRVIASIDTAKRPDRAQVLQSILYDLVIVDEAHRLKNTNTQAWKLVNSLQKKHILLLTATPVENRLDELFNLITLLEPGRLDTASAFRRKFVSRGDPLKPQGTDELKQLLRGVMIRNRRSTTGIILGGRTAYSVRIPLGPAERQFYDSLTTLVREHYGRTLESGRSAGSTLTPFALKTLQRELGSSVRATQSSLARLAERENLSTELRDTLTDLAQRAGALTDSAKLDRLHQVIESRTDEKVIVFTGFRASQEIIVEDLRRRGIPVAIFHGQLSRREKEAAIAAFRDEVPVLVSTESGGEGRNLQFCHVMVNFDLPWNPLRIEQRIGRIHRIGQTHDVSLYNLVAADTVESEILELLDAKINLFQLVVGELDMILGRVVPAGDDFEDLLMRVVAESQDHADLRQRIQAVGETLVDARRIYERVKQVDADVFDELLAADA